MKSTLPRFRRDIIIRRQETAEGAVFVIKDPTTGRFSRFQAPEQFITQQLDGATPLETVRQRVSARFGEPLSSEELAEFIKALDRQGLLEANGAERPPLARRGRVRGSLFYLRLKA